MSNILVSYPHSSIIVPNGLENRLNVAKEDLLVSMDFGTDKFFSGLDVQKLFSEVHLFFGNLNRNISGTHLITGKPYEEHDGLFKTIGSIHSDRLYKEGKELSPDEKQKLLESYYIPYYQKLTQFILSGKIDYMIDFHSCDPAPSGKQLGKSPRADIILGNRGDKEGKIKVGRNIVTFDTNLINEIKELFERYGLTVSLNSPFSGGNITQQFGSTLPSKGKIPTLQIEVNKRLYLEDDLTQIRNSDLKNIEAIVSSVIKKVLCS